MGAVGAVGDVQVSDYGAEDGDVGGGDGDDEGVYSIR